MTDQTKGNFKSNFGFLMAAVGAAIGLGNIWGFPYKMGANGGFAFLLIYLILAVVVGYPLMLGEIAIGRKTGKAAVEAFKTANPRFTAAGVFETIVPFLLLCFYCVLGGVVIKYMITNLGYMAGFMDSPQASGGEGASAAFFGGFVSDASSLMIYTLIFLALTSFVVFKGIETGIERFCAIGMPLLFVMLLITVIRCCTLPGAIAGLEFMFKPDFSVFKGTGWFKVFATAASQMFFSLSLASGAIIAYGSYMRKEDDLEKSAFIIPVLDTSAALLAGLAVFPAVFSEGLEPSGGPGLLFISLQTVFDSMGSFGHLFGFIFYALVFVAAFSSSIGMMEGGISAIMDRRIRRGSSSNRPFVTILITVTTIIGGSLVVFDQLGGKEGFWKPFGLGSWLDVLDMGAEGILMPLGGLLLALLLGWSRIGFVDDEISSSSSYVSRKFVNFCWRYIVPIFMLLVLFVQISTFFFSNTEWYKALLG